MTMSNRLRLAITLAPLFGALAFAVPVHAASMGSGGGTTHQFSGGAHGDLGSFHGHHHHHGSGGFGFGFDFGFWDPWWWGWDPVQYWGYPYPYYYPYYYPPYPAYYAPPPGPPPQAPAQATGAPPQQYWYYCDNPQGYYPYVQNCSSAWRQVAPTAPSGNTVTPKATP